MDGTMLLAVGGHWWVFFFSPPPYGFFFFFFPPYGFYFFFGEDELLSFLVDAHFSSLLQVFFFLNCKWMLKRFFRFIFKVCPWLCWSEDLAF